MSKTRNERKRDAWNLAYKAAIAVWAVAVAIVVCWAVS